MRNTDFIPKYDTIYRNAGGGRYVRADPLHDFEDYPRAWRPEGPDGYWMKNVGSGWVCYCVGIGQYEDYTIDWDYSKWGFFA